MLLKKKRLCMMFKHPLKIIKRFALGARDHAQEAGP
jgi:hypothetical protein